MSFIVSLFDSLFWFICHKRNRPLLLSQEAVGYYMLWIQVGTFNSICMIVFAWLIGYEYYTHYMSVQETLGYLLWLVYFTVQCWHLPVPIM